MRTYIYYRFDTTESSAHSSGEPSKSAVRHGRGQGNFFVTYQALLAR